MMCRTVFILKSFITLSCFILALPDRGAFSAEPLHEQNSAGFAIAAPEGWDVARTTKGFRLTREDSVINVRLHAPNNASLEAFFRALEMPATDGTKIRRYATQTVTLLSEPSLCGEYLTGTEDNDRRACVTYATHEGRGFLLSLDCAGKDRDERFVDFKQVISSFRIIPVTAEIPPLPVNRLPANPLPTGTSDHPSSSGNQRTAGSATTANSGRPLETLSDDELEIMLQAAGVSEVKRDAPEGDETLFRMKAGDRIFGVLNDKAHGQIRCYSFFGAEDEGVTLRRLRTVNAWNANNRFAKAFVYDNGSWVLESDLRYRRGIRPEAVMSHVSRFASDVPRFVKHVEEMLAAN